MQTQNKGIDAALAENIPTIIKIKPGSAAEKSMKFHLPDSLEGASVEEIVKYGLRLTEEDGLTRNSLRIQENIQKEMREKYGMTINGNGVKPTEKIGNYTKTPLTSPSGKQYYEMEIIVAGRQEGALEYRIR